MGDEYIQWNVRGLNDKNRRKNKVQKIYDILDRACQTKLLNIQETHITSTATDPPSFKNYEHIFHIIQSFATPNDRGAGICIFLNRTESILVNESLIEGRLVYLKTRNLASSQITNIFSFYGKSKNTAAEWKVHVDIIKSKIKINNLENIIIIGDFNFVTSILDRNNQSLNTIDNAAVKNWTEIEKECDLVDSFRITNPKRILYTYSHTDSKSKSRIDRIYVSEEFSTKIEATNFESTSLSDHKIIKLRIGCQIERGPGSWVFNNSLLRDMHFVERMRHELRAAEQIKHTFHSVRDFWDFLKMNIQSVAFMYANDKAKNQRLEKIMVEKEVERLERTPFKLLTDFSIAKLGELKNKLADFEMAKLEGLKLRAKLPTYEFGEPTIAFLAKLEKKSGERNNIYALKDNNGMLKEGTENLLQVVHDFYRNLYTREDENVVEQTQFLNRVNSEITREEHIDLEKDLLSDELLSALKDLKKNKSPGFDGITVEFYIFFWMEIKDYFLDCIKEITEIEELSEMQKRGAIRITLKKGNRDDLKNYRPITLLNVDLKIITRALSKRLAKVIPNIVPDCQKAVSGRRITENIHVVQDLINLVEKNEESVAMLFYDWEKAFDRLSHNFILKTLEKFGFGNKFLTWIKILLYDIRSFVKVNGYETSEFQVQRGVRQGCPLSPLLFVIVSEVLALEIRKNRNIRGYLHNNTEFKILQYADDLMTCVRDISSIGEILKVFGRYERSTNAKLNKSKTEALWVGKWRNRLDNPYNLKWTKSNVKFLGVYVGSTASKPERKALCNMNFSDIEAKMKSKLGYWAHSGLSVKGKIKVVNTFILSKIFYRLECVDITMELKLSIERNIRGFIWGDRIVGRVDYNSLTLNIDMGGLGLFDIGYRMKVMRVKWLEFLVEKETTDFERFLADRLIGEYKGIIGLKILNHNTEIRKLTKVDPFYVNSIKAWKFLGVKFVCGNIRDIDNEIIFDNDLLVNRTGVSYTFFNALNNQRALPKFFKNLPVTTSLTSISNNNKNIIHQMNRSVWELRQRISEGDVVTGYTYGIDTTPQMLKNLGFKEIYKTIIRAKSTDKTWVTKWNSILRFYTLDMNDSDWKKIWDSVHDNMIPYKIQSSIWTMLHLNFYSGYMEKVLNYGEGKCKLCGQVEEGPQHIVINCKILVAVLNEYSHLINRLKDITLSKDEIAFGIAGLVQINLDTRGRVRNLIMFTIRHIIFQNRYKEFGNYGRTLACLKIKVTRKIREVFKDAWSLYSYRGLIDQFKDTFLSDNILGTIDNGELALTL